MQFTKVCLPPFQLNNLQYDKGDSDFKKKKRCLHLHRIQDTPGSIL